MRAPAVAPVLIQKDKIMEQPKYVLERSDQNAWRVGWWGQWTPMPEIGPEYKYRYYKSEKEARKELARYQEEEERLQKRLVEKWTREE